MSSEHGNSEATIRERTHLLRKRNQWLWLLLPILMAFWLRAERGYRPFPSRDDHVYIPRAWHLLDETLYVRDLMLTTPPFHTPAWKFIVSGFENTIGLAEGMYLLTFATSIGSVFTLAWLLKACGAAPTAIPSAALLAFGGTVVGLGRCVFDGGFDEAFHLLWLAFLFLTATYAAFLERKMWLTGMLLGLTTLAHILVGIHASAAIFFVTLFDFRSRWKSLFVIAGLCGIISAPMTVPIAQQMLSAKPPAGMTPQEIIEKGFWFRSIHENTFQLEGVKLAMFFAFPIFGLIALPFLSDTRLMKRRRALAALVSFHFLCVLSAPWVCGPESLLGNSSLPYLLQPLRTSPMLVILSAVCVSAMVFPAESVDGGKHSSSAARSTWTTIARILVTSVGLVMMYFQSPSIWMWAGVLGLSAIIWFGQNSANVMSLARIVVVVGSLVSIAFCWWNDVLDAELRPMEANLYDWAQNTPRDSLFIIPPGLRRFRYYSQRSIYVDFASFRPGELLPTWRGRLEQISDPDEIALSEYGYFAAGHFDRCYIENNDGERIVELLMESQADFFVWTPSFPCWNPVSRVPGQPPADTNLRVAYRNPGFTVYTLKTNRVQ